MPWTAAEGSRQRSTQVVRQAEGGVEMGPAEQADKWRR
jgi:hypothetical protein